MVMMSGLERVIEVDAHRMIMRKMDADADVDPRG